MVLSFRVFVLFFMGFNSRLFQVSYAATPTTWGVFTPALCVSIEGLISKANRVNAGRVVFVCDVGGSGVGVENDFVSGIDSGAGAGTNTGEFCFH